MEQQAFSQLVALEKLDREERLEKKKHPDVVVKGKEELSPEAQSLVSDLLSRRKRGEV